ncbi:hypothetical protein [Erwinia phage vB_Ea277G]|nr:hypothetical protein [Erwinia phage vB_Ea277G]
MTVLFRCKEELSRQASIVISRLNMLCADPAIHFGEQTVQELFEYDYFHIYNYLQNAMFTDSGEIKWALATHLERAGFIVHRVDIGVCIKLPIGDIEVASKVEAMSRTGYLLPSELRAMEAGAQA